MFRLPKTCHAYCIGLFGCLIFSLHSKAIVVVCLVNIKSIMTRPFMSQTICCKWFAYRPICKLQGLVLTEICCFNVFLSTNQTQCVRAKTCYCKVCVLARQNGFLNNYYLLAQGISKCLKSRPQVTLNNCVSC